MSKIIVAGSINMDVVAQVKQHPRPGETIFSTGLSYIPGGKGSNQAVAASRLGENVYLMGKLGKDGFGTTLRDFLSQENLNLDYLTVSETEPTGVALIAVDNTSENTIIVTSGSNFDVSADDIAEVTMNEGDIVASVFEIPQTTIHALFTQARKSNAKTVLNPAPAAEFHADLLSLVDYLVVNETELAFFAGNIQVSDDLAIIEAQAKSLRYNANQTIIVTLGAKGVLCVHGDSVIKVDGRPVEAVDTTGAGDCFVGALCVALSEQQPIDDALEFATTAASLSVQQLGASASMPYRGDVG